MFRRFLVLLWLALVGVVGLGSTGTATATTTPGAASYTDDGPALAHVEVHGFGVAGFSQTQLIGAPELSASPSVEAHRPPTTPLARNVATEAGPDFVAGPIGSEPPVPMSQSRMAAGFDEAGFPSTPTASPGTEYTLPDGTKVRLMEPSGQAPMRASFTNANGGPINPFTGKPVQPPAPAGWSMKDWVRALTHVVQTP